MRKPHHVTLSQVKRRDQDGNKDRINGCRTSQPNQNNTDSDSVAECRSYTEHHEHAASKATLSPTQRVPSDDPRHSDRWCSRWSDPTAELHPHARSFATHMAHLRSRAAGTALRESTKRRAIPRRHQATSVSHHPRRHDRAEDDRHGRHEVLEPGEGDLPHEARPDERRSDTGGHQRRDTPAITAYSVRRSWKLTRNATRHSASMSVTPADPPATGSAPSPRGRRARPRPPAASSSPSSPCPPR